MNNFDDIIESIRHELNNVISDLNIPGIAFTLVSKNEILLLECLGHLEIEKVHDVNADSLFCLQSTTKTVTAVVFLLAVQKGLVQLDDPVIKYYSDFSVNSRYGVDQRNKITFRHLLSHTSGLARESRDGGVFDHKKPTWREHILGINDSWLKFPVGTSFSYSNIGMDLTTYILEQILGKTYPELIQDLLGDPLGIKFAFGIDFSSTNNVSRGYLGSYLADELDTAYGCGGIFISIKDMGTFIQFLLNRGKYNGKEILKEEYFSLLLETDKAGGYSLGTDVKNQFGTVFYSHPGGGFGYCSELFWSPDHNFGLSLLYNQEYTDLTKIKKLLMNFISSILENKGVNVDGTKFPPEGTLKVEVDSGTLKKYIGYYVGAFVNVIVNIDEKGLYLDYGEQTDYLIPLNEKVFTASKPDGVNFLLNDDDDPIGMHYYSKTEGIAYLDYKGKIPKPIEVNKEVSRFEGIYQIGLYYTEALYIAVKYVNNALKLKGFTTGNLYPHPNRKNVFFTHTGAAVVFENDYLFVDNVRGIKITQPVDYFADLVENDPKHKFLTDWMVNSVVSLLKYLERDEESYKIKEITKNLK
ncbi:MAG: beta-lactamase family protein [Candidatus Heimdallarchaeota archaeon]|nr:MAG: beta-lactamase family protein [Candidatus Heimdallarchaeota archaeon]